MSGIVVIGAGQAAASLVAKLRAEGHDGAITLIGSEPVPPYQRPPLSKAYLLGDMEEARLYLRPKEWYAETGVDLRTGVSATALDPGARTVTLSTGEVLSYEHCALTTGAAPRRLPAAIGGDLSGVHTVRDLADADAMAPEFKPGARLLVVGGGYIGLEAAAVGAKKGLDVTLIEAAPRILGRVACAETATWFADLHRARGVNLREGLGLEQLTGKGRVTGALLADGTRLEVDFAIVGIGVAPRTALAEAAGLAIDNGIACDAYGRTSDPHVWAAGDCASFPHEGNRMRLESVGGAIDMAEAVARNMLGAETPYTPKPWFWSDQFDVKLQIAGLGTGHDHIAIRADGAARSHWYYAGGRLIALDAMNDGRAYMVGKRLIEAGKSPTREAVADPATDLKDLLRA